MQYRQVHPGGIRVAGMRHHTDRPSCVDHTRLLAPAVVFSVPCATFAASPARARTYPFIGCEILRPYLVHISLPHYHRWFPILVSSSYVAC